MPANSDHNSVMYLNSLVRHQVESSWTDRKAARVFFFGKDCQHILPINVDQKPYALGLDTVDDLNLSKWLSSPLEVESHTRADCIDDRTLEVDRFPFDSKNPLPAAYTIIWSHKFGVNKTIAKLSNYKLQWTRGNIVVIKCKAGSFAQILDAEEADLSLVMAIVMLAIEIGKMSDKVA